MFQCAFKNSLKIHIYRNLMPYNRLCLIKIHIVHCIDVSFNWMLCYVYTIQPSRLTHSYSYYDFTIWTNEPMYQIYSFGTFECRIHDTWYRTPRYIPILMHAHLPIYIHMCTVCTELCRKRWLTRCTNVRNKEIWIKTERHHQAKIRSPSSTTSNCYTSVSIFGCKSNASLQLIYVLIFPS